MAIVNPVKGKCDYFSLVKTCITGGWLLYLRPVPLFPNFLLKPAELQHIPEIAVSIQDPYAFFPISFECSWTGIQSHAVKRSVFYDENSCNRISVPILIHRCMGSKGLPHGGI